MKPFYSRYVASLGALLLLALSLVGCRDTLLDRTQPDPDSPEQIGDDVTDRLDGAVTVSLTYDTPALRNPQTRALSVEQESELKLATTRVMVFKSTGAGEYLRDAKVTKIAPSTDDHQQGEITFLALPGEGLTFVVLANLSEEDKVKKVSGTKAEVLRNFEYTVTADTDFAKTGLPMWGELAQQTIDPDVSAVQTIGTIHLLRAVARVDVGLNMSEKGTNGNDGDFDEKSQTLTSDIVDPDTGKSIKVQWSLLEVKLYNAAKNGRIAPDADNYDLDGDKKPKATKVTQPTTPTKQEEALTYTATDNLLKRTIYVPETVNPEPTSASAGASTTPGTEEVYLSRPYLILKLSYKQTDGNASGETYFRVDFLEKNDKEATAEYTYLSLLRNFRYKVDIRNIGGLGFDSEDEAKKGPAANIMYNVVVWDESTLSNVVYDGQYMLGVQNDKLLFHKNGGTFSTKVQTSWPEGFKVVGLPDWVKVKIEPSDPGAKGLTDEKIVTFEVKESTTTKRDFSGAYIQAGRMRWNLDITQLNTLDLRIEIFADEKCKQPLQYIELDERGKTTDENEYSVGRKKFYVRVTANEEITSVIDDTKEPFIFVSESGSEQTAPLPTAKKVGAGLFEFEVTADKLDNPLNPFEVRQNKYHFITEKGGQKASAELTINQTEYNIVFYEDESLVNSVLTEDDAATFFMDGGEHRFWVRSNIPYEVWLGNQEIDESVRSSENSNPDGTTKIPMVTQYKDNKGKWIDIVYDASNPINSWKKVMSEAPTPNGASLDFRAATEEQGLKIIYGHTKWVAMTPMKSMQWKFPLLKDDKSNANDVAFINSNFVSGSFLPEANCYPLTLGYGGVLIPLSRINHAADFYEQRMDPPANFGQPDYVIGTDKNACIGAESWETYKKRNSLNRLDEDDEIDIEVLWTDVKSVTDKSSEADRNPVKADGSAPLRFLTDLQVAGERYIYLLPGKDGEDNYGNVVIAVRSSKKKKVNNLRAEVLDPYEEGKKTILWSFHLMIYRPSNQVAGVAGIPKNNGYETVVSNSSITYYNKKDANDKEYTVNWEPEIYSWPYDLGAFKIPDGWENVGPAVKNDAGRRDFDYRAIGMSYQYGRKDPFPRYYYNKVVNGTGPQRFVGHEGKEVFFKLHKETTISMRESIENPMVVVGNGRGEQWLTEGGSHTASNIGFLGSSAFSYYGLWGGGGAVGNETNTNLTDIRKDINRITEKTVFDPTPYGFSVPTPGYASTRLFVGNNETMVHRFLPNFVRHFANVEYRLIKGDAASKWTIFGVTDKKYLTSGLGEQGWAVSTAYTAQAHYPVFTLKPGTSAFQQRYVSYCNRSSPIGLRPFNNPKESDWENYIRR